MGVRILVDSTADVTDELKKRLYIVPLTINFGEEEFIDGVTINHKQFYEKLIESDVLPTTSQASPDAFDGFFKEAVDAGDSVVAITISSKLSGTCQSANIAAAEYSGKVFVVDSKSVAIGTGILAKMAIDFADSGLSAEEIHKKLCVERENIRVIALLDTLEYLKRGGRISKTTAMAGTLLSIKPVVEIRDGEVGILGKARGSKQGNNLLVKEIEDSGGVDFSKPFLLGFTGLDDTMLKKYIQDSAFLWQGQTEELPYTVVGSVVGTHIGPGVVAAAYFKNER